MGGVFDKVDGVDDYSMLNEFDIDLLLGCCDEEEPRDFENEKIGNGSRSLRKVLLPVKNRSFFFIYLRSQSARVTRPVIGGDMGSDDIIGLLG
jgi:hypothetical protein